MTAQVTQDPVTYPWVSIEDADTGEQMSWCSVGTGTYSCNRYFQADWDEQADPQQHHFYAQLWYVGAGGAIEPGPQSATETVTVLPAELSVSLAANPASVRWYDTTALTATSNRDANNMP